jgi:hypothetical protein
MMSRVLKKVLHNCIAQQRPTSRFECTPSMGHDNDLPTGIGSPTNVSMLHALQLKFVSDRIASYAMQGAGAMVLVNVMRIPCFGRRMTIGRASIVWPGAS